MPGEHAYFSPSASSRWLRCPASLYLAESIEEQSSSYAHEGTVCHAIAADCLTKNIPPANFAGEIIDKVPMTSELIDGVQLYVDEIKGLTKEYNISGGRIEYKVTLTPECWGTVDAVLWNTDTLIVCDLKMGKGVVVSAEDNDQLKLYSIGALRALATTFHIKPYKILNVIIQPRTPDPVRKFEITRKELGAWSTKVVEPILMEYSRGKKGSRECEPGLTQCRWCPVSRSKGCAAEANKNISNIKKAFSPFVETAPELPVVTKEIGDGILTVQEMAGLKKCFQHVKSWMESIEKLLMESALAGISVPGFKLVEGRSVRVWNADEDKIVNFLERLHAEPYVKKLVSPAQAEKLIGKKQAKQENLYTLIIKPKGKPTLVLETDKRVEIQRTTEKEVENAFGLSSAVEVEQGKEVDVPVLIVDTKEDENDEEIPKMSALQRMRFAEEETAEIIEEEIIEEEKPQVNVLAEVAGSATGGDPKIVFSAATVSEAKPPAKTTVRFKILQMGKGGLTTLQQAATTAACTVNMVKMHLKYLNERDGYDYAIFDNDVFKVTEGE